ncbi:MAG: phosphoribosylformylglycinamidine synthase subunit PurQ [Akkermansia sp.]
MSSWEAASATGLRHQRPPGPVGNGTFPGDALQRHHAGGGLLLGICNGFQILTKLGILPDSSLIDNKKERFECVWAKLVKVAKNSPFLQGLPDEFELPSAHAEGRLVTRPGDAEKYLAAGNVALQYVDNRDGCECSIAGLRIPPAAPWA